MSVYCDVKELVNCGGGIGRVMNIKLKNGYVTEEKFILECLSRNIPISRPIYNTEPYDFIIEINGTFKSVQVKKSWTDKKNRKVVCIRTSSPRLRIRRTVGEQKNVDYLAVLVDCWDWYIIPRVIIEDVKVNISVSTKGRYKEYYNNWTFE